VPDEVTAVPAAPPVEPATDSNLPASLVWGIFIVVLVLLAGAVFWWRRKNTVAR
jgi:LPXTG-motif cell wall-anchored protein